jgi:hypothetical protein
MFHLQSKCQQIGCKQTGYTLVRPVIDLAWLLSNAPSWGGCGELTQKEKAMSTFLACSCANTTQP